MFHTTRPTAFSAQLAQLHEASPQLQILVERHSACRDDWQPGELLRFSGAEGFEALRALRQRAAALDREVRIAVALNLLTEEGLPGFHRVVSVHIGELPVMERWISLWTAEEDRHGNVLRDYVRDADLYDMAGLDRLQFEYLRAGFEPDWAGSPYRLLAYASLQEHAMQLTHANTARLAARTEPLLQHVLARLAADEARHCAFYRDAYAILLARDPDNALLELAAVAPALGLPGETIPGYPLMAEIERQAGIFGPREYAGLLQQALDYWHLGRIEPHGGEAREARDLLLALPQRLLTLAGQLERRARMKSGRFDFLREQIQAIGQAVA